MANTTSGTTTFDKTFSIEEIIEDAFERIGLNSVAGYQLKSARRSLNILFQEWGNRGIHYWEVGSTKGGIAGSIVSFTAIDTATYMVHNSLLIGSGTIVTPYADA